MTDQALEGGFGDAAIDAARAFRAAMVAMARPGRIVPLVGAEPPAPLSVAAGTLLLTLCDGDTPLHLAGDHDTGPLRDWIAFHTGVPVVQAGTAAFAVGRWRDLAPLDRFRAGTPEYPDRSVTLIVELDELHADGVPLAGPGIRREAALNLPEPEAFRKNAERFPLGLDFFFTAGDRVAALPRSTRIAEGG